MRIFLRNCCYSITGNIIALVVSVCMILVIPRYITTYDYGMWQLFIFYFSYVGLLHMGWEDGIYLRYAGKSYNDIDKSMIWGQIVAVFLCQCIVGIAIYAIVMIFYPVCDKGVIFKFIAIALILANTNNLFSFIFQITSRIKDYAQITAIEPMCFIIMIMLSLFYGICDYLSLIICKFISLASECMLGMYLLSSIRKSKIPTISSIYHESKINIVVGSKLMLANIASMLVIGIVRFGISEGWDVVTFGKVSLTLSVSNFLLVFINAVSIVLLPTLKNIANDIRQKLYIAGRSLLTTAMLSMLLLYYPLNCFLSLWLPQYVDALIYMAVLFPICLYETRMGLLISTYLKAMRQEKLMLKINVISVLVSAAITVCTVYGIHELTACVASIVVIFAFRCYFAEIKLSKILNCHLIGAIINESIVIASFMLSAWFIGGIAGAFVYMCILMIYIGNNIKKIKNSIRLINNR